MSKIGKIPIKIPKNINIKIKNNIIKITSINGVLEEYINPVIFIEIKNNKIILYNKFQKKENKKFHGLYRSLINNMIIGLTEGFEKKLEIIGIGYKAKILNNNILELNIGYSHLILFHFPKEIVMTIIITKEKNYILKIKGINKQLVGQIAAKIKLLRKIDPYKGRGIKYLNEKIKKKVGKSSNKK